MNPFKHFFNSFKRSLFDISYYKDVAVAGFGSAFRYLWFLLLLLVLIKSVTIGAEYMKSRPQIVPGVQRIMGYVYDFYPRNLKLTVKGGQLTTNVKEPYIFDLESKMMGRDGRHFIIIDTKGSIEDYPQYNTYVLATRNAVVYPSKSENNQIEQTSVFYFKDIKNDFTIDRASYDSLLNKIKPYTANILVLVDSFVAAGLILFVIFGSLVWSLFTMLGLFILNLLVWIINLIFKKGYNYSTLYKMGMHAVTLPILVGEAIHYSRSQIPTFYSLIFLVVMMVIVFSSESQGRVVVKTKSKKPKTKK